MRRFGLIATSIWESRRFNQLTSPEAKLAYLYLHTNRHGQSCGAYRLPAPYLAADLDLPRGRALEILEELEAAGLIEYDAAEEVVRLSGFFKVQAITNSKHLAGTRSALELIPDRCKFKAAIAVDVIASGHDLAKSHTAKGRSSKGGSDGFSDRMFASAATIWQMLREWAIELLDRDAAAFRDALAALPERRAIEIVEALSIGLSIGLPIHRNTDTNGDVKLDTIPETLDRDVRRETLDVRRETIEGKSASAREIRPPSPSEGGRSGGSTKGPRQLTPELEALARSVTTKARGRKA